MRCPPARTRLSRPAGLLLTLALGLLTPVLGSLTLASPVQAATTAALTGRLTAPLVTRARTTVPVVTTAEPPGTPVLVTSQTKPPTGFRLNAHQVLAIASANAKVRSQLRRDPHAVPYEYTKGPGLWQVSWFSTGRAQKELIQVYISDADGRVTQVWTGFQVAWTMARGYPGAFGRQVNAWYLWIPLCILFVAPFAPWPWRWPGERGGTSHRPALFVLDLLMLLGFSISLALFNHADIGLSVPLVYPFLIYALVRMLLLAGGRGLPRVPLRTPPASWLGIGTVFLMAFRIGLNVLNSNVIDVGFAGVIGADKLVHGQALYGHWPANNRYGDTYGPVSYFLYVPFRLIFGWSGRWDSLPAAHAAAIFFDLLTLAGLFLLGRRLRNNRLGATLAYLWAAYPFTLFALNSNTNDSLVAATLVFSLLVITSPPARGVMSLLAGATKFAPLALAPLFLRGIGPRPRPRSIIAFIVAFGLAAVVVMLPVLLQHDLGYMWHDSIAYQSDRVTPFSVWGLWGGLTTVQNLLQGAVIAMAVGVALLPERRGVVEVAALGAAVLCALQITLNYWLYPYIVWFFPFVIIALVGSHPEPEPERSPPAQPSLQAAPIPIRIIG